MKEGNWRSEISNATVGDGEMENCEKKKKHQQEFEASQMCINEHQKLHHSQDNKHILPGQNEDNDQQELINESNHFQDDGDLQSVDDQMDALKVLERCLLTKRAAIERQKQLSNELNSNMDQSTVQEQPLSKRQKAHQENRLKSQQLLQGRQPHWKKDDKEVNLSFCGCGFLGIYHVGVASCFHQYAPQLSMQKISGSSAGALIAMAHICGDLQLAYCTTDILTIAIEARSHTLGSFHPSFDIQAQVRESLERGLPEDAYLKATGKLHVSLTRVEDGENVIINKFDSNEDLIQVLLCSCFIPFWSGISLPKYRGVAYIDGGFSNNLLVLDEKTVTVSPFAGEADICPQDDTLNLLQINLSNTSFSISPSNLYRLSHALLPPEPEILSDLCKQGFADGIRYLQRMNLISCTKCLEIRSSLLVTADGEDMEEVFSSAAAASTTTTTLTTKEQQHSPTSVCSDLASGEHNLQQHIVLEQQEQETIEIAENSRPRRGSVVSIHSNQRHHHHSSTTHKHHPSNIHHSELMAAQNDGNNNITPAVSLYNLLNGIDDDSSMNSQLLLDGSCDADIYEDCNDCVLIRQRALYDPLPKLFRDRIREASDKVNKSLSKWIYSHRPVKYLSYLMVPYYVPIDLTLAIVYRFWKKLPTIRKEVSDCVNRVLDLLITILRRMQSRSTTAMLMGFGSSWEEDVLAYEKELMFKTQKQQEQPSTRHQVLHHHHHHHHHHATTSTPASATITSANSTTKSSSSLASGSAPSVEAVAEAFAASIPQQRPRAGSSVSTTSHHPTKEPHSLEDTFDSIVDVTSKQEARIFAYYFRDAKNRLQVTEIFDLERTSSSQAADSPNSSPMKTDCRRVTKDESQSLSVQD